MRSKHFGAIWVLVLAGALAQAACLEVSDGTMVGSSEADAIGADLALGKDSAPETTAADAEVSEILVDVGADLPSDAALVDVAAPDAPALELAPADVPPVDTQPADVPPVDVAKPDVSTDPCAPKIAQFDALKGKALACATPFECFKPAPADAKCQLCQRHYNGNSADSQNLADVAAVLKASGCGSDCGSGCSNMATHVGVCAAGQCTTKELTCKELDTAASAALAQGAKCTADADCTFKVSNTLGCGCPTFVNVKTMGPAKPLFNYMKMLVLAYKAKLCTAETACACPDPNTAKCVAGVCIAQ